MYIIATFEQSGYLELALSALEQKGLPKENIMAIPLDKRTEPRQMFDTIHNSDGFTFIDLGAVLGTCLMLLGAVYGYIWPGGPIVWGIIGAVIGLLLGFFIKYWFIKYRVRSASSQSKSITSEVVLLIRCEEYRRDSVEKILWEHLALGVSSLYR